MFNISVMNLEFGAYTLEEKKIVCNQLICTYMQLVVICDCIGYSYN
jgi:hypothetical protein